MLRDLIIGHRHERLAVRLSCVMVQTRRSARTCQRYFEQHGCDPADLRALRRSELRLGVPTGRSILCTYDGASGGALTGVRGPPRRLSSARVAETPLCDFCASKAAGLGLAEVVNAGLRQKTCPHATPNFFPTVERHQRASLGVRSRTLAQTSGSVRVNQTDAPTTSARSPSMRLHTLVRWGSSGGYGNTGAERRGGSQSDRAGFPRTPSRG